MNDIVPASLKDPRIDTQVLQIGDLEFELAERTRDVVLAPARHPLAQLPPPATLAPAAALNLGAAALSSDPLRPQYEELRAGGLGDVSRLGLAPDPLATPQAEASAY